MGCGCENRRLMSELDRMRRLAKALALMEDVMVIIYRNDDGTYGFEPYAEPSTKTIVEYISNI